MFEISAFTSKVVKIHLVKSSYQVFSRVIGNSRGRQSDWPFGRCPRDWLPGEKKPFGIARMNPKKDVSP